MKKLVGRVVFGSLLVGCGSFGSDSAPAPEEQLAPPSTPQDNAQPPPVDGTPVTGVYVSSSMGSDDGSGTPGRPLKTLKRAFALAKEQQLRVIACAETYAENVVLLAGVSAYGYYDCAVTPWKRVDRRATVTAPASPAAVAKGIAQPTRLEGFAINAPDLDGSLAKDGNGASIALEVRDSTGLVVSESLLHGGTGARGEDGVEGPSNAELGQATGHVGTFQATYPCNAQVEAVPCNTRTTNPGAAGGASTCAFGASGGHGGTGGDGEWFNPNPTTSPTRDVRGRPFVETAETAAGGLEASSGNGGRAGQNGGDGANGVWSLTKTGFVGGDGTNGSNGSPGQGGAGGGGNHFYRCPGISGPCSPGGSPVYWYSSSGSGGSAGGCPGIAGTPGTGGGATIAVLAIDSSLTIERSRLETATGGKGGTGTLGSKGLVGGPYVNAVSYGGVGLPGGAGGSSGLSGHGSPGPAIALAYAGARPVTTAVDLAPGPGATVPELRKPIFDAPPKVLPAMTGQSLAEYEIK